MGREKRDGSGGRRMWLSVIGALVSSLLLATPVLAVAYTITVQTDKSSYAYANTVTITGKVSPAPGPNTAVFVSVLNPNGKRVDLGESNVDPNTGSYSHTTVTGGGGQLAALWISGTYTVNASWGSSGTAIFQMTTFLYNATVTTTTTSSTTTSTSTGSSTSSTSSTSTASSTTSTSSTSTSTSSAVPEFNPQAVILVSLIALAAAAVVGRAKLSKGLTPRI